MCFGVNLVFLREREREREKDEGRGEEAIEGIRIEIRTHEGDPHNSIFIWLVKRGAT